MRSIGIEMTFIRGYEDLTRAEIDDLWTEGVDCDDWDYMVVCPPDVLKETEREEEGDWDTAHTVPTWEPKDYSLGRILTGCCSNQWYKVKFRGKQVAIGVAYHA